MSLDYQCKCFCILVENFLVMSKFVKITGKININHQLSFEYIVNTMQIVYSFEDEDKKVCVYLSNGDVIKTDMNFQEVQSLLTSSDSE